MKKTYSEFLDELSMYADGAEIKLSLYDYRDNEELYRRAMSEGYIMLGISSRGYPIIRVIRSPVVPYLSYDDINSYFN